MGNQLNTTFHAAPGSYFQLYTQPHLSSASNAGTYNPGRWHNTNFLSLATTLWPGAPQALLHLRKRPHSTPRSYSSLPTPPPLVWPLVWPLE